MFKKIIILLIFQFPILGYAQIGEQLLLQIEKLNNSNDSCEFVGPGKSNPGLFQACYHKICTENKLYPATMIPATTYADMVKPAPNEQQIEYLFDKMISGNNPMDAERNKLFDSLRAGDISYTNENMDIAFNILAMNTFSKVYKLNPTTYKFEFDEEKFKNLPLQLSQNNKLAIKEAVVNLISNMPSIEEIRSNAADNAETFYKRRYPGISKQEAVKKMASELKADYEIFKQSGFGKFLAKIVDGDSFFPTELVAEIESGKDITDVSVKELIAKKRSFDEMRRYFGSDLASQKNKVDYSDLKSRIGSAENIEKAIEESKTNLKNEAQDKIDGKFSCLSTYRQNMIVLPTKEQVDNIKKELEVVKRKVSEKWASKYSVHTQKKISEYLSSVDFFLPPTKKEFEKSIVERMQRKIHENNRAAEIKIKDRSSFSFIMAAVPFVNQILHNNGEKKSSNEYLYFCDKDKVSSLNDANYTLMEKIQVSYTTVLAPDLGRGVLAHELGHGISQIFRSKNASDESSKKHKFYIDCLTSLHEQNGPQYVEEDYSDWVSANITDTNFACLFSLDFPRDGKVLDNQSQSDVHSGAFFRLLHTEFVQKGRIPGECNQLLVEQKSPKDFLSCQRQLENSR